MKLARPFLKALGMVLSLLLTGSLLRAQTTVQVTPPTSTVLRGGTVNLSVGISGVSNLLASRITVSFDNTKLQYASAANGTFMPSGSFFKALVNGAGNMVTVDQSILDQAVANGDGTLFTISFTALEAVSGSAVTLTADLRDPNNVLMPATLAGSLVTVENPLPHVTNLSPAVKISGEATFDLTVTGSGFVPTSVVWFKGVPHTTTYVGATTLTASIPATDLIQSGAFPVTVVNPGPGGGTSSEVVNLQINPGAPAVLGMTSGDGQSATISSALNAPFVITVTDAQGNPVPGVSVSFAMGTVPAGATGQNLSQALVPTDANGQASVTLTLGSKVGDYAVTATAGALVPLTFHATATVGAAAILTLTSGDPQTGTISAALGAPFVVTVTDAGGNPVAGASVMFEVATFPAGATGSALSNAQPVTTDGAGQASTTLTLGNKVGPYTVTATSGVLGPVTFHATATAGAAANLTMTSGDGQSGTISTTLAAPFVVTVTDAGGNPVAGVNISFAFSSFPAGATGQAFSNAQPLTTDANGQVSTTLTLGNKAGDYAAAASGTGLGPVTFHAAGTAGAAANLTLTSGDGQTAAISTALAAPFVVTVTDVGGNPVAGISVTFAIMTVPTGASGQLSNAQPVTTDASGRASTMLTLGEKVGTYTVSATSGTLSGSPVTFTATALAGPLDHFTIGEILTQTEGTPFDVTITAQDIANNTVAGYAGPVALAISAGTVSPTTSGAFTNGLVTVQVTAIGAGTAKTISVSDGSVPAHTGVSNSFDLLAMPKLFLSQDAMSPTVRLLYPNDAWGTTGYETNDWSYAAPSVAYLCVVPEPGLTFSSSSITLNWDATKLALAAVEFGEAGPAGSPNGLFGTGQGYTHTESFVQNPGTVTITATRTDGGEFSPVHAGDFIARVEFTLLKPCSAAVTVQSASFHRLPSIPVQVASQSADVKAYLGDVASPMPGGESTGDGKIDFDDLVPWSYAYWSGVDGYVPGLAHYKVKYDIGPTQDRSVFSLPAQDTKIDFEDLVIFSISYGMSVNGQLPKIAPPPEDPVNVFLGAPETSGKETRIPVVVSGTVTDVRAMRLELKGDFGTFLGAEKGALLKEYQSEAMVMSRSGDHQVFVDLAVLGLQTHGVNKVGEVAVLRFEGPPSLRLTKYEARNSGNVALPLTKVQGAGEAVPTTYMLKQNYPNPFNPTTTIAYEVPTTSEVTLEVFNMLGQKVATLVNDVQESGFYQVHWNGQDSDHRQVASGLYLYRMHAGSFTSVKKMVLLK